MRPPMRSVSDVVGISAPSHKGHDLETIAFGQDDVWPDVLGDDGFIEFNDHGLRVESLGGEAAFQAFSVFKVSVFAVYDYHHVLILPVGKSVPPLAAA
jgi:hypothetical protein